KMIVKLQIWDITGIERYYSLDQKVMKDSLGIVLCFDLTKRKDLLAIECRFYDYSRQFTSSRCVYLLVGMKSDLNHLREVTREEAEAVANSLNMSYIETSPLTAENVDNVFTTIEERLFLLQRMPNCRKIITGNHVFNRPNFNGVTAVMVETNPDRCLLRLSSNEAHDIEKSAENCCLFLYLLVDDNYIQYQNR